MGGGYIDFISIFPDWNRLEKDKFHSDALILKLENGRFW